MSSGVKVEGSLAPTVLTPKYREIIRRVSLGESQTQIAKALGMSLAGLSYYVKRLKEVEVIVDGARSISKGLRLNPHLDLGLKTFFCSVETSPKFRVIQCNAHHLSVRYPVIENHGLRLKHERAGFRGNFTEQLERVDNSFFRIILSAKRFIVHFPEGYKIYVESDHCHVDLPRIIEGIVISIANKVKEKHEFKGLLKLGLPSVGASYAFPADKFVQRILRQGVRVRVQRGGTWCEIDASKGHFRKKGEIEFSGGTSAAHDARRYILKIINESK